MRYFATILLVLTILPLPLSAATLEEIDQQLQSAETPADLLKVETLIRESPPSADLTSRLAKTYFRLGKESGRTSRKEYFTSCVEQADKTIKLDSRLASGYFFKGLCEGRLGEINGVWSSLGVIEPLKKNMETAITLDPAIENGGPHRALGRMYHELPLLLGGDLDKSLDHLKEAVRLGPDFGENYFFLAETYYTRREYPLAEKALNDLLEVTKEKKHKTRSLREQAQELLKTVTQKLGASHAQGTENP